MGGISVLMFMGESPVWGVVFGFVGLIALIVTIKGMPRRERPYERFELIAIWLGFPLVFVTFVVLVAVGFLPGAFTPWLALYAVVAAVLFVMMVVESRRRGTA